MNLQRPAIPVLVLVITTMVGCGTLVVSPRYVSQDIVDPTIGGGADIELVIVDERENKDVLGITQDPYKREIKANRPVTDIVRDGFRRALMETNWKVTESADLTCRVTLLECHLVWAARFSSKHEARVSMNVALLEKTKILGIKRINEDGWIDNTLAGDDAQEGARCFSVVLSRAIDRAVSDRSIFALGSIDASSAYDEATEEDKAGKATDERSEAEKGEPSTVRDDEILAFAYYEQAIWPLEASTTFTLLSDTTSPPTSARPADDRIRSCPDSWKREEPLADERALAMFRKRTEQATGHWLLTRFSDALDIAELKGGVITAEKEMLDAEDQERQLECYQTVLRERMTLAERQACYAIEAWLRPIMSKEENFESFTVERWDARRTALELVRNYHHLTRASTRQSPPNRCEELPPSLRALVRRVAEGSRKPASLSENIPLLPGPPVQLVLLTDNSPHVDELLKLSVPGVRMLGHVRGWGDDASVPFSAGTEPVNRVHMKMSSQALADGSWYNGEGLPITPSVMSHEMQDLQFVISLDPDLVYYVHVSEPSGGYLKMINLLELAWDLP